MKRMWLILGVVILSGAPPASAQEPAGFAGFGWGTPRALIAERLVPARCGWSLTMSTLSGQKRIVCRDYRMNLLGPVYLTLDFINDALRGYVIAVPRRLASELRTAARELLSEPAVAGPTPGGRAWKTNVEFAESTCTPGSVCLAVTAY
jgi:hypothetical protein